MRASVEVERQVALTLYYLSDDGRLSKTANAFELSPASVSVIIRRVTTAISLHMGSKYIKLPFIEFAVLDKVTTFYETFAFPQCLGAEDCTHTDTKQPRINPTDYINSKGRCSLNVQACCDYRHCSVDVVIRRCNMSKPEVAEHVTPRFYMFSYPFLLLQKLGEANSLQDNKLL